jgi:prophage regulatory protein
MLSSKELITWKELKKMVPYSRTHIARLEKAGEFPKRVRLSSRRVAWVKAEVEAWIAEKMALRTSMDQQIARHKPGANP